MLETAVDAVVLVAHDARRRPRVRSSPRPSALPSRAAAARSAAADRASAVDRRLVDAAVLVVAHVRHRGALRLQPHDARAVARRPREGRRCSAPRSGMPLAAARAVADARAGRCGGSRPGSRGWRSSCWCWCSTRRSSRRCSTSSRRCRTSAARERIEALLARCGFARSRAVRHGRLAGARATATRISPASAAPSASCSSTRCSSGSRRTRSRRCSRTSSAISGCATWSSASLLVGHAVARALALLGWLADAPWFYAGLGVPQRRAAAMARPASRWYCSCWRCRCSRSSLAPLSALYSRRHEFEADAFAARARVGDGAGRRAGQALRGQRRDADARSAAFGVLRFASARRDAHRAAADAGCGRRGPSR